LGPGLTPPLLLLQRRPALPDQAATHGVRFPGLPGQPAVRPAEPEFKPFFEISPAGALPVAAAAAAVIGFGCAQRRSLL